MHLTRSFLTGRFDFRSPGQRKREVNPSSLLASPATLVVVPGPLVVHWKQQVERHMEPFVFQRAYFDLDHTRPLPSAEVLAGLDLLVIPKERLRREWVHGKPVCHLDMMKPRRYRTNEEEASPSSISPLLQIKWLRIVVDEGHSLGAVALTNECEWLMKLEEKPAWRQKLQSVPTGLLTSGPLDAIRPLCLVPRCRAAVGYDRHPKSPRRGQPEEPAEPALLPP